VIVSVIVLLFISTTSCSTRGKDEGRKGKDEGRKEKGRKEKGRKEKGGKK
jgi:hypothetical protein